MADIAIQKPGAPTPEGYPKINVPVWTGDVPEPSRVSSPVPTPEADVVSADVVSDDTPVEPLEIEIRPASHRIDVSAIPLSDNPNDVNTMMLKAYEDQTIVGDETSVINRASDGSYYRISENAHHAQMAADQEQELSLLSSPEQEATELEAEGAAPAAEEEDGGFVEGVQNFFAGMPEGLVEGQAHFNDLFPIGEWVTPDGRTLTTLRDGLNYLGELTGLDAKPPPKPEGSLAAEFGKGFAMFIPTMIPLVKALRMAGSGPYIADIVGGALADVATSGMTEAEGFISMFKMLPEEADVLGIPFGELSASTAAALEDFINADPGSLIDTNFRARLFAGIPGVVFGSALTPALQGIGKLAVLAKDSGAGQHIIKAAKEFFADTSGSVKLPGQTTTAVSHTISHEADNPNSIINNLYNATEHPAPPEGAGRWTKALYGRYIEKTAIASGRQITVYDDAAKQQLSDTIANEAVAALNREGNASNWYNTKITEMSGILQRLHPELVPGSTEDSMFKFLLAVTSNGSAIDYNMRAAEHLYGVWKNTGKLPSDLKSLEAAAGGFGKEGGTLAKQLILANRLSETSGSWQGFVDFLNSPTTVKELNSNFGLKVGKEAQSYQTHGSVIFGPKIGGGFYQNLIGNFEPVTFDRWWEASWGRWTGDPMVKITESGLAKQAAKFTAEYKKEFKWPKDHPDEKKRGQGKTFNKGAMYHAQKIYAAYKKNNFQPRTDLNKAAQRFVEGRTDKMAEEAGGAAKRTFMRATVAQALEKLRELGYDITPADLQATVWYPEKELHGALGIGSGRSAPDDYALAAQRLVDSVLNPGGDL